MTSQNNIVRITTGAERDLTAIYRKRSLQRGGEGPDGADALLDTLVRIIESLGTFAGRGPVVPELDAIGIREYRQISQPPFRIIYHLDADCVTIILVADARRDFQSLLSERLLTS